MSRNVRITFPRTTAEYAGLAGQLRAPAGRSFGSRRARRGPGVRPVFLPTFLVVGLGASLAAGLLVFQNLSASSSPTAYWVDLPRGSTFGFGMDAASADVLDAKGAKPDYLTFWIGPWILDSGWNTFDAVMQQAIDTGTVPAIEYYYWGDEISPTCLQQGCWSAIHDVHKDMASWQALTEGLVAHLNSALKGGPAIIIVETEFNKDSVVGYEPLDGLLADKIALIREGYPEARIVLGLGNWRSSTWGTWDRAAAASDFVGIQGVRGSTKDALKNYEALYESTLDGARTAWRLFAKPIMLHDIALSSYPDSEYRTRQANVLREFFTGISALEGAGVQGMIYRSFADSPTKNTQNYYGIAERHWGLAESLAGPLKPAAGVWIEGVKAVRAALSNASSPVSGSPVPTLGASGPGEGAVIAMDARTATLADAAARARMAWGKLQLGIL